MLGGIFRFLIVIVIAVPSMAQDVSIRQITSDNGLSHNTVSHVMQDSQGFIWITTIDGLNKYDGYKFTVYRHDPADSTSISTNFLHHVYEDSRGTLWIGTRDKGVNAFNRNTGMFKRFEHNPADPASLSNNKVGSILEDRRGNLWIGTDDGLNVLEPLSGQFRVYRNNPADPHSLSSSLIEGFDFDAEGMLWIATDNGLNKMDPATGQCIRFLHDASNPSTLTSRFARRVLVASDGMIWVGTRDIGFNMVDPRSGRVTRYFKGRGGSNNYAALPMLFDAQGRLWLSSGNGIFALEPSTSTITHYEHTPANPGGLTHNNISTLARDRHGNIWAGTWGGGINVLEFSRRKFDLVRNNTGSNFVLAALEDRDSVVWIGYGAGLYTLKNGKISSVAARLEKEIIWALTEFDGQTLWAGTDKGIAVIRNRTLERIIVSDRENPSSLPDNTIRAMLRDNNDDIWAGTQTKGLTRYSVETKSWQRFPFNVRDGSGTSDMLVWALQQDAQGIIWIGTYQGGLNRLDTATGQFSYYMHNPEDPSSLPSNDVRSICVTRSGDIWIGTYGGGIARLEQSGFVRVTERDGLGNNFVYGIVEDGSGKLWISTNKGLTLFDPVKRSFRVYTSRDGLQSDEFNTGAYHKSRRGEMFFGGVNGLNRFFPDNVKDNPHVPPVVLTSFKVFDKEVKVQRDIALIDSLTLSYKDNFFSFEFAALDFVDPSANRYAYMLEGFDTEWIESGTRRYASYTNLDPGEYTLRIRGANNDGVWNESGQTVRITIVPPYWQRWWFRLTSGLLAVGAFAGLIRYFSTRKLRAQLQELEKERALQEERERISRDLHDHAGAQFAGIITGLEIAGKYNDLSDEKAREFITSLRDDARSGMMRLRETIWALKTDSMTPESFADAIQSYADRQLRHPGAPVVTVSNSAAGFHLSPNQVLNLYRIVQESLTNIVKHADASSVSIELRRDGGILQMAVQDDGAGVSAPAFDSGGQGFLNMQKRAAEMNGTFEFGSNGRGTCVIVRIPVASNGKHVD